MKEWLLKKRGRVVLAGVLAAAVPLVGLAAYVHFSITAALKDRVIKETGWFSAFAVHHLEDKLQSNIALGSLFVTRPLLQAGIRQGDKREMLRQLRIFVENAHGMERAFIASPQGILLADYPVDRKVHGRDFSSQNWYKGVSLNWRPYVSEFYLMAAKPQRYVFNIAIPVKSAGAVIGILVMQPKADWLKDVLSGIEIGKGHIYIVDRKGRLIYHPHVALDRIVDFSEVPIVQKVMQGMQGIEQNVIRKTRERCFPPINRSGNGAGAWWWRSPWTSSSRRSGR